MAQTASVSKGNEFITRLHDIILENIDNEHFGVSELAHKANISRSHLHRKIHIYKEQSVSQFINDIRLEEAYKLLIDKDQNIAEVAYKVGFNSPSYFSASFHAKYGITPGDVKKNNADRSYLTEIDERVISSEPKIEKGFSLNEPFVILTVASLLIITITVFTVLRFRDNEVSIAVLPLDNLTGSEDNAYFVDGMHDALIGALGKIQTIRVISRTSTLQYANKNMLLADIAKELNVNTIVEGSVYGASDSLRIIIQLIKVFPKEKHLWTQEYNDQMAKVLNIQNDVTKQIAQHININFTDQKNPKQKIADLTNPESYKDYLRGMYYLKKGTREDYNKGLAYLHKSIERDPADPFAYAALSLGYAATGHGMAGEDAFQKATAAAQKALKIDPGLDDAHTALAMLYLYNNWEWEKSRTAFENAVQSNPNNEMAQANYAWYFVLFNDLDKAIYHAKIAEEIDPFSSGFASWLALIYLENNQLELAKKHALKALQLKPENNYANLVMACVYLKSNSIMLAKKYIEKLPKKSDYFNLYRSGFYASLNDTAKLNEIWEYTSTKKTPGIASSGIIAYNCGHKDIAFKNLHSAIQHKQYPVQYIGHIPFTKALYNEPEFQRILKYIQLPYQNNLLSMAH